MSDFDIEVTQLELQISRTVQIASSNCSILPGRVWRQLTDLKQQSGAAVTPKRSDIAAEFHQLRQKPSSAPSVVTKLRNVGIDEIRIAVLLKGIAAEASYWASFASVVAAIARELKMDLPESLAQSPLFDLMQETDIRRPVTEIVNSHADLRLHGPSAFPREDLVRTLTLLNHRFDMADWAIRHSGTTVHDWYVPLFEELSRSVDRLDTGYSDGAEFIATMPRQQFATVVHATLTVLDPWCSSSDSSVLRPIRILKDGALAVLSNLDQIVLTARTTATGLDHVTIGLASGGVVSGGPVFAAALDWATEALESDDHRTYGEAFFRCVEQRTREGFSDAISSINGWRRVGGVLVPQVEFTLRDAMIQDDSVDMTLGGICPATKPRKPPEPLPFAHDVTELWNSIKSRLGLPSGSDRLSIIELVSTMCVHELGPLTRGRALGSGGSLDGTSPWEDAAARRISMGGNTLPALTQETG